MQFLFNKDNGILTQEEVSSSYYLKFNKNCNIYSKIRTLMLFVLFIGGALIFMATWSGVTVAAKQPVWTHTADDWVETVDVSADGKYMVAGTAWDDTGVYLFNVTSGEELWNHSTSDFVNQVAISAEGDYIVAGGDDLYLYERSSGTPKWTSVNDGDIECVDISADGEYLVGGGYDNTVYLYDKDSANPIWSYQFTGSEDVYTVAISADGEYIFAGSGNGNVYLFDKDNRNPVWNREIGMVISVDISANGSYLTAVNQSGVVFLFGRDSSTPLWSYAMGQYGDEVAISDDGAYLAAGSRDNYVYAFGRDSSTPLWEVDTGSDIFTTDISGDGNYVVAAGFDHELHYIRRDNGTTMWTYDPGGFGNLETVALSYDGSSIGLGGSEPNWVSAFHQNVPTINDKPVANILDVSPNPAAEGEELFFDGWGDDNDGTIVGYRWQLNGVTVSTNKSFNLNAPSAAIYLVEFRVQDDRGDWSQTVNTSLRVHERPRAAIVSITPNPAKEGETVTFQGFWDDDGTVVAYEWRLDGYVESDLYLFSRSDLTPALYAVKFRVQDNDGAWSESVNATLVVNEADNLPPTARIESLAPNPMVEGGNVTAVGDGSDPDGTVVAYRWSLDGVEVGTTAALTLTNLSVGEQIVELLVQDDDGAWSGPVNRTLVVNPDDTELPVATIVSVHPNPSVKGQRVFLEGRGYDPNGTLTAYKWLLDGLEIATTISTFLDDLPPGNHSLEFRVLDDEGFWSEPANASLYVLELTVVEQPQLELIPLIQPLWNYTTDGWVTSVDITSSGVYVAAGTSMAAINALYMFEQSAGTPILFEMTQNQDGFVSDVDLSGDGSYLAATFYEDPLPSWWTESTTILYERQSNFMVKSYPSRTPSFVALSDDGELLISSSSKSYWEAYFYYYIASNGTLGTVGWSDQLYDLAINQNGYLVVAAFNSSVISFRNIMSDPDFDWKRGKYDNAAEGLPGSDYRINSLDVSDDGSLVVAGTADNKVVGLSDSYISEYGRPDWRIYTNNPIYEVHISGDGNYIAYLDGAEVALLDLTIPSWKNSPNYYIKTPDFGQPIYHIDISDNGQYLLVGGQYDIFLFDIIQNESLWRYSLKGVGYPTDLAISDDGNYMVVGTSEGELLYFGRELNLDPPGGDDDDSPSVSLGMVVACLTVVAALLRTKRRTVL